MRTGVRSGEAGKPGRGGELLQASNGIARQFAYSRENRPKLLLMPSCLSLLGPGTNTGIRTSFNASARFLRQQLWQGLVPNEGGFTRLCRNAAQTRQIRGTNQSLREV